MQREAGRYEDALEVNLRRYEEFTLNAQTSSFTCPGMTPFSKLIKLIQCIENSKATDNYDHGRKTA